MSEIRSRPSPSDEIDLVDLGAGLWQQKWIILVVTALITLAAGAYAFMAPPVYQASVQLLPPRLSQIAGFNAGRLQENGLKPFSVDEVYAVFVRNLRSEELRRTFFRDVYLPALSAKEREGSQDALYARFEESVLVQVPDRARPERFELAVKADRPELAASLASAYVLMVGKRSLEEMSVNAERELEVRANNLQRKIDALRISAQGRREDRLSQLREALEVALAIGLEEPPMISSRLGQDSELSAFMDGSLMYMRGAKALGAEIKVLEARTSDDPFIPELRSLQEEQRFYNQLDAGFSSVAVYRQDGEVAVPDRPIEPRRPMIISLALVFGLMLGVFIALVRFLMNKSLSAQGGTKRA